VYHANAWQHGFLQKTSNVLRVIKSTSLWVNSGTRGWTDCGDSGSRKSVDEMNSLYVDNDNQSRFDDSK
jgi:hypothetical protein